MLVHRHSNFVNLSKYDALLSLEASKVYCRHCLTRIFSVTFRPVTPLRRLPLNSAVQDWFIKNCLTCCQHALYKEILVVMLLFKYFANLFCIFLNLKNNNNCTRQGCCFFHPLLYLFVFCLFTAQTNGAKVLCRKTGPACRRHRQDQWVSKNARELHRRVYHIDSTPFISLDNFSLFMNMVKNLDNLNWLMSLWWSTFSLAQSAGCVLGNTLIFFVFVFFFRSFGRKWERWDCLG